MADDDAIPGVGTEPGAGTEGEGAPGPAAGARAASPSGSPDDYEAKIRSDPEFALKEVKNQQSGRTRAEARLRSIVERIGGEGSQLWGLLHADGVTGEALAKYVQRYAALSQNPQAAAALQRFEQTGQFSLGGNGNGSADAGEDDLDDFDPMAKRIKSLEAQLQELRQGHQGLTLSSGKAALQSHLQKLRGELALDDEGFSKVNEWLNGYIRNLDPQNPTTESLMRQMQDPNGYKTLRTLALGHIAENAPELLDGLGERKRLRDRQSVARYRTDVPSGGATTGREPPAELLKMGAEEVIQFYIDHPEFV